MDDIKKAIYLEALRITKRDNDNFICINLVLALQNILNLNDTYVIESNQVKKIIKEFFPEFYILFDNKCWYKNGKSEKYDARNWWWEPEWNEPRIRILNYILNHTQ